ncbi:hypothetical protein [Dactylosporangium sp. NPDC050588]|uniref:hypothetical protein n=1 Tax=Dactylosporangium sp. NPDC050588 TaxID=3157211 RepID=UPI0033FEF14C
MAARAWPLSQSSAEAATRASAAASFGATAGPDGWSGGGTVQIQSLDGIVGADIPGGPACGLTLNGVFTGGTVPPVPAPARLDFAAASGVGFTSIRPVVGQVFFVGDGLTGTGGGERQQFIVPTGAEKSSTTVVYVPVVGDRVNAFQDHSLCDRKDSYINGLQFEYIVGKPAPAQTSFHPNYQGQRAYAEMVVPAAS